LYKPAAGAVIFPGDRGGVPPGLSCGLFLDSPPEDSPPEDSPPEDLSLADTPPAETLDLPAESSPAGFRLSPDDYTAIFIILSSYQTI